MRSKIIKKEVFTTTDGDTFNSEYEAKIHQTKIDFPDKISWFRTGLHNVQYVHRNDIRRLGEELIKLANELDQLYNNRPNK